LTVDKLLIVEVAALLAIQRESVPLLELGIRDFLRLCYQDKQYGRFGQRKSIVWHHVITAKSSVARKWSHRHLSYGRYALLVEPLSGGRVARDESCLACLCGVSGVLGQAEDGQEEGGLWRICLMVAAIVV
jgi:hypothetical protein